MKSTKMKVLFLSLFAAMNIFVFSPAHAALISDPLCGSDPTIRRDTETNLCVKATERRNVTDILIRGINILLAFAALIAVLFIVLGGYKYITSGGNAESAKAGKGTVVNAIIGLTIIILAWVIVAVVNNTVSREGRGGIGIFGR